MTATIVPRQLAATIVVAASDSLEPERASWDDALGRYLQCDGTADEVEIQAAIDALPTITVPDGGSDKVGKVILLEGVYNISATINITQDGVTLQGMGHGTHTQHGVTLLRQINGANLANMLACTGNNTCLRDFFVDGNKTNNPTAERGIGLTGGDSSIENVTVCWCKTDGIYLSNVALFAKNVFSEYNSGNGFELTNCSWGSFNNLITADNDGYGIELTSDNCDNMFYGCIFYMDYAGGVSLQGSSICNTFVGCTIDSSDKYGFLIDVADRNIISGCIIKDCGKLANNTYHGILLSGSAQYNIVQGCQIFSDEANKPEYGIREHETANYNIFKDNMIAGVATERIYQLGAETKAGERFISIELFLTCGAIDKEAYFALSPSQLVSYKIFYTAATGAGAGVAIRIGRYQSGVALDDGYFDISTSELNKAQGYSKFYGTADLTNSVVVAGDTITVGTAGGKADTGKVVLVLQVAEMTA